MRKFAQKNLAVEICLVIRSLSEETCIHLFFLFSASFIGCLLSAHQAELRPNVSKGAIMCNWSYTVS